MNHHAFGEMACSCHPHEALMRRFAKVAVLVFVFLSHIAPLWLLNPLPSLWRTAVATRKTITVLILENPDEAVTAKSHQALPHGLARVVIPSAATEIVTIHPAGPAVTEPATNESQSVIQVVESPSPSPLNLQLPKGWAPPSGHRHPALERQLGQGLPQTLETRLGNALGDGQWTEERLGDGRFRLRNGNRCIYFQRSRSDELHSFSATQIPWLANAQAC